MGMLGGGQQPKGNGNKSAGDNRRPPDASPPIKSRIADTPLEDRIANGCTKNGETTSFERSAHTKVGSTGSSHATSNSVHRECVDELRRLDTQPDRLSDEVERILDRACNARPEVARQEIARDLLFEMWSGGQYDEEMIEHEVAIEHLVYMLVALHSHSISNDRAGIFGDNLLELSCGSGTIIELLARRLPLELVSQMRITANDISRAMQNDARIKMAGLVNRPAQIEYTNYDIRHLRNPNGSLILPSDHTNVILAQTLPFLTDPALLEQEQNGFVPRRGEHRKVKMDVLESIFGRKQNLTDRLLQTNGHFTLIDEWPWMCSVNKSVIDKLFSMVARSLSDRSNLEHMVFSLVEQGARLRAIFKACIGKGHHSMYAMDWYIDPVKIERLSTGQRSLLRNMRRNDHIREETLRCAIGALTKTDEHFRESYPKSNGRTWVPFVGLEEVKPHTVHGNSKWKNELVGRKHDVVILQELHSVPEHERNSFITTAVGKVNVGGALIFADEWEPGPQTETLSRLPKWPKHRIKEEMKTAHEGEMMFQAMLREPFQINSQTFDNGIYLLAYRKYAERDQ